MVYVKLKTNIKLETLNRRVREIRKIREIRNPI
jgi:hypothetical protein